MHWHATVIWHNGPDKPELKGKSVVQRLQDELPHKKDNTLTVYKLTHKFRSHSESRKTSRPSYHSLKLWFKVQHSYREYLTYNVFADDIVQLGIFHADQKTHLESLRQALEGKRLRINRAKTEDMNFEWDKRKDKQLSPILAVRPVIHHFKALESVMQMSPKELGQAGRNRGRPVGSFVTNGCPSSWKTHFTGQQRGQHYCTSLEYWVVKKRQERRMHGAEMGMFRYMTAWVTRNDRVRNEYIRGWVRVADIRDKMTGHRLWWFDHRIWRRNEDVGRAILGLRIGNRWVRGRPQWVLDNNWGLETLQFVDPTPCH